MSLVEYFDKMDSDKVGSPLKATKASTGGASQPQEKTKTKSKSTASVAPSSSSSSASSHLSMFKSITAFEAYSNLDEGTEYFSIVMVYI